MAVHWALAALIATSLLDDEFDSRSLTVVLLITAIPDLDVILGMYILGTHRAALHNIWVPLMAISLIYYDVYRRDQSFILTRFGTRGLRIAWISILAFVVAGIGLDLFWNGVNLFYPVHDRFFRLWGKIVISNQRGLVQTVWQTAETTEGLTTLGGTTQDTHYSTGVDPTPGEEPPDVERIFPIAQGGFQLALIVSAIIVTTTRLWMARITARTA